MDIEEKEQRIINFCLMHNIAFEMSGETRESKYTKQGVEREHPKLLEKRLKICLRDD